MFYMEKYKETHFIDGECDTKALNYVIHEFLYLLLHVLLDLKTSLTLNTIIMKSLFIYTEQIKKAQSK